jgi:predicted 3-demethylubiquinone-9 3-methyltransferase (glyoxalase superfamily)
MTVAMTPFLLCQGRAEEALKFYVSLIPGSQIGEIVHFPPGGPRAAGTVMKGTATIAGQTIRFFDSPVPHDFDFTPAISLFVECENEVQLRQFATALADGGAELMPLGDYGFSQLFAWVNDRFGVSWQLNLA